MKKSKAKTASLALLAGIVVLMLFVKFIYPMANKQSMQSEQLIEYKRLKRAPYLDKTRYTNLFNKAYKADNYKIINQMDNKTVVDSKNGREYIARVYTDGRCDFTPKMKNSNKKSIPIINSAWQKERLK